MTFSELNALVTFFKELSNIQKSPVIYTEN